MSTTRYILAPNARWQGRDQTGKPVINGKLYTYVNQTTTPKATYKDYLAQEENTNPVVLDGKGEANIYWASDGGTDIFYTIKLYDKNDNLVYTQDNYPFVGTNETTIIAKSEINYVRNPQFSWWRFGTSFAPVSGTGEKNFYDFFCDDWLYQRTDTSYTVNLTRETFTPGQIEVNGNPSYYLRYQNTSLPSTELDANIHQHYKSVRTLSGKTVSVGLMARSATSSTIRVYLVQIFGSGGSPSPGVVTLVLEKELSPSWALCSGTIEIPSITGKSIGTNGDDFLALRINFPNDEIATVDLCNVQLLEDTELPPFYEESLDVQFKNLNTTNQLSVFTTGDVKVTLKENANNDPGWLLMGDQTIGNIASGAGNEGMVLKELFTLIWGVSAAYAPIYDSSGNLTTRGVSAEADYNALKRLALTKTLGRVIASAGQAVVSTTFTANAGNDRLTIADTSSFYNAVPVTLTTTGTLPSPLAPATTYYVIYINGTEIALATSAANAINDTFINITNAGTGTHTISINYTNWVRGQFIGEINHGLILGESPTHGHDATLTGSQGSGGSPYYPTVLGADRSTTSPSDTISISTAGGSAVHNNMQPTVFLNYMIKI